VHKRGDTIELSARMQAAKATRSFPTISPFRLFVGLYVAAFALLVEQGHQADAFRTFRYSLMFLALAFVTNKLTTGESVERPRIGNSPWIQFALIGAAIFFTGLVSSRLGSEDDTHFDAIGSIYSVGCWQYFVEVCAVFVGLRLLGLTQTDLGFQKWARGGTWVAVIWIATAIGFLTSDMLFGVIAPLEALHQVLLNVFRNGFSEEFLFRGVLLSRLRAVVSDDWALFTQAILFGVWHYGADVRASEGNALVTACFMITVQAVFGYALGYLALRTRSIAIGAAFHAIADATDII
jgi:membrane protease YdiL (CAAX protease family)